MLTDLSPSALIDAINRNLHDALEAMGKTSGCEHLRTDTIARWRTTVPHAWFNGITLCADAPANADSLIADTLATFAGHNVEAVTCWLSPSVNRSTWEPTLTARGFIAVGGPPGMAIDLSSFETPPVPDSLEIKRAEDALSYEVWGRTFIAGYGYNPDWEYSMRQIMAELDNFVPTRNYIGTVRGEPVSTASLVISAGAAGIYNVATLEPHRGKGLGAALTAAALQDAKALGYQVSILQASDLGFPIYRKLGFTEYCKTDYFQWRA